MPICNLIINNKKATYWGKKYEFRMYIPKHNSTRRFHEIGAGLHLYNHINMKLQMLSDSGVKH